MQVQFTLNSYQLHIFTKTTHPVDTDNNLGLHNYQLKHKDLFFFFYLTSCWGRLSRLQGGGVGVGANGRAGESWRAVGNPPVVLRKWNYSGSLPLQVSRKAHCFLHPGVQWWPPHGSSDTLLVRQKFGIFLWLMSRLYVCVCLFVNIPLRKLRWLSSIWLIRRVQTSHTPGWVEWRTKDSTVPLVNREVTVNLHGSFSTFSSRPKQLTCVVAKTYMLLLTFTCTRTHKLNI